MVERLKTELDLRSEMYRFYFSAYVRAIFLWFGVNGALLKFAIDAQKYRGVFSVAALLSSLFFFPLLIYGFVHMRRMTREFESLAESTGVRVSTEPAMAVGIVSTCFWFIGVLGWIYLALYLT